MPIFHSGMHTRRGSAKMNTSYGKHHRSSVNGEVDLGWSGRKGLQTRQDPNFERQVQVMKCGKYISVGGNKTQRIRVRNTNETFKRTIG